MARISAVEGKLTVGEFMIRESILGLFLSLWPPPKTKAINLLNLTVKP